jgi:hypothetical protein
MPATDASRRYRSGFFSSHCYRRKRLSSLASRTLSSGSALKEYLTTLYYNSNALSWKVNPRAQKCLGTCPDMLRAHGLLEGRSIFASFRLPTTIRSTCSG